MNNINLKTPVDHTDNRHPIRRNENNHVIKESANSAFRAFKRLHPSKENDSSSANKVRKIIDKENTDHSSMAVASNEHKNLPGILLAHKITLENLPGSIKNIHSGSLGKIVKHDGILPLILFYAKTASCKIEIFKHLFLIDKEITVNYICKFADNNTSFIDLVFNKSNEDQIESNLKFLLELHKEDPKILANLWMNFINRHSPLIKDDYDEWFMYSFSFLVRNTLKIFPTMFVKYTDIKIQRPETPQHPSPKLEILLRTFKDLPNNPIGL